jgi:hypothetical protein
VQAFKAAKGRLMKVYVRTQICKWTVGMLMFISPAMSEPRAGVPILSLSQLEGANIHSTLVTEIQTTQATGSGGQQLRRSNGTLRSGQVEQSLGVTGR